MAHPVSRDILKSAERLLQVIQFGKELALRLRGLELELSRPARTALKNLQKTIEENKIQNQIDYKKFIIDNQCHTFLALLPQNLLNFWKP